MSIKHFVTKLQEHARKWTKLYRFFIYLSWLLAPVVIFLLCYHNGIYDRWAFALLILLVIFQTPFTFNRSLKFKSH